MKKTTLLAIATAVAMSFSSFAFAGGSMSSSDAIATPIAVDPIMAPYSSKKMYKFDAAVLGKFLSGRQTMLQQLTCPTADLLQAAGLTQTSNKWTNVAYTDSDTKLSISYDFVSCNLNGYQTNYDYNAKHATITDATAIATARQFMNKSRFKDVLKNTTGEPIIVNRYNGGMMMPLADGQEDGKMVVKPIKADDAFTNISVLFPYVINGKPVYANYGGRVGITIEVTDMGVQNFNGQYINFPGTTVTSKESLTKIELAKYIKKGGNNRYYGKKYSVQLGQPQDVYAIINDWTGGTNTMYLSSAILLPTTLANDEFYAPWSKYEMLVTDYKFGNPNMMPQSPMY